jgi:hypothetical protein
MDAIYTLLYWVHVPVAVSCIPAFWIAGLTKKGGPAHVRVGRWFAYGMMFVALTGSAMGTLTLIDPFLRVEGDPTNVDAATLRGFAVFLIYLGTITFCPVYHGVRVIRTRRNPESIRTPLHTVVCSVPAVAAVIMAAVALGMTSGMTPVLLGMSPIGLLLTFSSVRYIRNPTRRKMEWWYEHMLAMLAGGIAAHTAFGVFFVVQLLGVRLPGAWQMAPWLLPTIIGVPAMVLWVRAYEHKFETDRA